MVAGGLSLAPTGPARVGVKMTDWGRREPSKTIALNALQVLKSAGRLAAG